MDKQAGLTVRIQIGEKCGQRLAHNTAAVGRDAVAAQRKARMLKID